MKSLFVLFITFFLSITHALEIDEKLTLRIVGTSESKKTILINRGIEDGLAKGDHAKFFVSAGVIARGVVIKVSPTRSVWSVYRVVNSDFLNDDQVMKLKITPAVKITNDESRMLVNEDSSSRTKDPRDLGIPLAEGADDLTLEQQAGAVSQKVVYVDNNKKSILDDNKEIFSMFEYSSLTEKSTSDNDSSEYSSTVNNMNFRIGLEWYFNEQKDWYHRFSFFGQMVMENRNIMSHMGTNLLEESRLFGGGVNFHLFDYPSKTNTIIHYLNYTLSVGSSSSSYTSGGEVATAQEDKVNASVIAYQLGYGLKYYSASGLGARVEFSYQLRSDSYDESEQTNVAFQKNRVGPKVLVGLGYRF